LSTLWIVIAVVLVLVAGAIALAIVNVNGILEENRGRLTAMASDALGREVDFSRAEVAFSRGLAVRVSGLRIAEDPRFGEPDFLTLESAFVGVRIWPALFGEIAISGVRLDEPVIRVIQTAEGFNFASIGAGAGAGGGGAEDAPDSGGEDAGGSPEEEDAPLALAIAAFEIDAGTVFFEDRTASPRLALTIEELETSGTDLALDGPLVISFSGLLRPTGAPRTGPAAVSSRVEGEVEIDDLATTSGRLRLRSAEFFPSLVGVAFVDDPRGDRVDGLELEVGLPVDAERVGYAIALDATGGRLSGFDFEQADIDLVLRGSHLTLENVFAGFADGRVELKGDMELAGEGQPAPFDLDLVLRDLDAAELATLLAGTPEGAVSGRIDGKVDLAGDSLEWERLKRTLVGHIALEMGQGALEKVNLLDRVVSGMVADPGLGTLAAVTIRDAAPDLLSGDRTTIEHVGMGFDVEHGTLTTDDLEFVTGDFELSAIGRVGLDGAVAGRGKVALSEELSRRLVRKSDALAALEGEGNRLEVPIRIGGSTSAPDVTPDLKALGAETKRDLRDRAAEEIADRIFGKKKKKKNGKKSAEGESAADSEEEPPSDRDAAEEMLRRGIGRLLGDD
jgi:hypothetical protein